MPAVYALEETVSPRMIAVPKARDYSHLRKYQYQVGQKPPIHSGRPKGSKNATTILIQSAPKLAKSYVRKALNGDASVLIDSRKWIMPTDGESAGSGEDMGLTKLILTQIHLTLSPQSATSTPTLRGTLASATAYSTLPAPCDAATEPASSVQPVHSVTVTETVREGIDPPTPPLA